MKSVNVNNLGGGSIRLPRLPQPFKSLLQSRYLGRRPNLVIDFFILQ